MHAFAAHLDVRDVVIVHMHQSLMDFLDGMLLITPAHQNIHAFAAHLDVREASLWFLDPSVYYAHHGTRDLHAHQNIHAFAAHLDVRDVVIVHMHQSLMAFWTECY
jgi:hypothetical protein